MAIATAGTGAESEAEPAAVPPEGARGGPAGVRAGWRRPPLALGWTAAAMALALLLAAPILVIGAASFGATGDSWHHVARTLLPGYVRNTVFLVVVSCGVAFVLGVGTAWLVATCEFPGRRLFRWALVLPLAVPAYMAAYTYAAMLDVTGPIQRLMRAVVPGASDTLLYWNIMRIEVVALIFALVLFPYVYLPTRALFERQSGPLIEAARMMGRNPWLVFLRVAIPLARPAIAAGLALVAMEVFNDYGAVAYFGVTTFTTGIFRAWFSLGDVDTAIRLSGILMLGVFMVLVAERWQRRHRRYALPSQSGRPMGRYRLSGGRAWAAVAACAVPLLFGFLVPVAQLGYWAWRTFGGVVDARFLRLTLNSFAMAAGAGLICLLFAVILLFALRLDRTLLTTAAARLAILGYSIPGAVIAVGVLVSVLAIERWFGGIAGLTPGVLVSGTVVALLFALVVRFMAVAYLPVEAGFARIGEQLDAASRTLGAGPVRTLLRIDLPLLRGSLLAALTLVVVDVLKELPITLILRPFNFDTLATRAFQLASDEQVAESAPAALLVIATAAIVVVILDRAFDGSGRAA